MEKAKIKASYDREDDILYLLFEEGPSYEIIEADPDVHLELVRKGEIMGIEIWNVRRSGLIKKVEEAMAEIRLNFKVRMWSCTCLHAACHWLRISSDLALRLPRLCVNLENRTPSFWVKGAKLERASNYCSPKYRAQ